MSATATLIYDYNIELSICLHFSLAYALFASAIHKVIIIAPPHWAVEQIDQLSGWGNKPSKGIVNIFDILRYAKKYYWVWLRDNFRFRFDEYIIKRQRKCDFALWCGGMENWYGFFFVNWIVFPQGSFRYRVICKESILSSRFSLLNIVCFMLFTVQAKLWPQSKLESVHSQL